MPNRDIKDSWRSSKSLDAVSAEAERLFVRLITAADDFGRYPADLNLMLAACFPRRAAHWKPARLLPWYEELETQGLVATYIMEEEPYGTLVKFRKHQRPPRARRSKYPDPSQGVRCRLRDHVTAHAGTCRQMTAHAPDLRSSVLRSSIPDLRSSIGASREEAPSQEAPKLEEAPTRQSEGDLPENLKTTKSGSGGAAEDASQAQPQAEIPGPIGAVGVSGDQGEPFDQRAALRRMKDSLSVRVKMEPVVGPGEGKRRLKLADRARARSPTRAP